MHLTMEMIQKKKENFDFTILAKDGNARAAVFHTPHGTLQTPLFAPVGTQATVKSITPAQLEELGATLVLSNTYHLFLRPGADLVAKMGGLHEFMQWPKPMLTDSGGFQVFSLSNTRKIDEDGATFKSHIDGSTKRLTPEISIDIQEKLGADIIMAFDECADPNNRAYIEKAMERTHRWAQRCIEAKKRDDQALFGIVQGGVFDDLRAESARTISSMGFPGHAIGGLSVGETKTDMYRSIDVVNAILPEDKPRYLMGVGTPEDLIEGVLRGVDIFDCVLPTRLARHNSAMTMSGRLNMMNKQYAEDSRPIDATCSCYTCQTFSRAYIRHLIVAKEMLAGTLLSIHNLHTLLQLARDLRQAIIEGRLQSFADEAMAKLNIPRIPEREL
ncbi:MAG: tRNA guanosine(34) transglycosylase Tgt [Anaerolineaceae bacterium]|nr:tRNA guanosine(34) transglycosylase Tgt [Anaerolineaceae bacterium]